MSVKIAYFSPSTTKPVAIPAHGDLRGTPASINASEAPQTVAIDEDPFDSKMSETTRTAYGKSSSGGSKLASARSANAPCPISRRPGPRRNFTSPTENGGKIEGSLKRLNDSLQKSRSRRC